MTAYQMTLRVLAVAIFAIAAIHSLFGVSSEVWLGSGISATSLMDANLDSQNRFYGAAFALFGAVFWLASADLVRYAPLLRLAYLVFFVAGAVRLLSIVMVGWPTSVLLALTVIELAGPPLMAVWLTRCLRSERG